jgi:5-methylcytosine-specific restriction protein A
MIGLTGDWEGAVSDVGTTPRKPLTPTQRLKLFEAHHGRCCICGNRIIGAWVDEHIRPLALGGGNEGANRGPAHRRCAALKTSDDLRRIAKAKAQKRAELRLKGTPRKIPSAAFPQSDRVAHNLTKTGEAR